MSRLLLLNKPFGVICQFSPEASILLALSTLAVAALVIGFVNALVKPILVLLSLPLTIVTLGLFYLVVNGACLMLAAALVPGFTVSSWGSAIIGALVLSIIGWLLNLVVAKPA